jgi:hypothetical protein
MSSFQFGSIRIANGDEDNSKGKQADGAIIIIKKHCGFSKGFVKLFKNFLCQGVCLHTCFNIGVPVNKFIFGNRFKKKKRYRYDEHRKN